MAFVGPVHPAPEVRTYPTILDLPPPKIRFYPVEAIIAEKLEAIVSLGAVNSRLKDFYDIRMILGKFTLNGSDLQLSVQSVFDSRETGIPGSRPAGLSKAFAESNQTQWEAFLNRIDNTDPDFASLKNVIEDIWRFTQPILSLSERGNVLDQTWAFEKGWRK